MSPLIRCGLRGKDLEFVRGQLCGSFEDVPVCRTCEAPKALTDYQGEIALKARVRGRAARRPVTSHEEKVRGDKKLMRKQAAEALQRKQQVFKDPATQQKSLFG